MSKTYDFVVIGAGVFGSWTALCLRNSGSVALIDAYGPANSRASSGGESRIIRMGYGPDELYTRWSALSLERWQAFFARVGKPLFQRTGVLWLVKDGDLYTPQTQATLAAAGIPAERLSRDDLQRRFPQYALNDIEWGLLEPNSGVLMARRAVQALVDDAISSGVEYISDSVLLPNGHSRLEFVTTASGTQIYGSAFVFCCGPWLPKMFPGLLANRFFITRQDVFFFGTPAGSTQFTSQSMPTWICIGDQTYGMPDIENRGLKIAFDFHGDSFDPDNDSRLVTANALQNITEYLGKRFPRLNNAPLLETRVCQYENTSNGDFLIDRHPELNNVWIVGGGSGHGFKHGPAIGGYASQLIVNGCQPDARFSISTKEELQRRDIF